MCMKKSITLLILMLGVIASSWAQPPTSGACGKTATWAYADGVLTISGSGAMGDYGTSEPAPWDAFKADITKVEMADAITTIGYNAFNDYEKLEMVKFPSSLTVIGGGAFYKTALTNVNLSGFTKLTAVYPGAFNQCNELVKISLSGCTALVTFDNGALSGDKIESVDFTGCSSLELLSAGFVTAMKTLKSVSFKNCSSLKNIGGGTFANYSNLENVDFTGCTSYEAFYGGVFANCLKLKQINFSELTSLITIDSSAFSNVLFTELNFSGLKNLTTIRGGAFYCPEATSINLSGCTALATIGGGAFNCPKVTSINLSGCTALEKLEAGAFFYVTSVESIDISGCTSLKEITTDFINAKQSLKSIKLTNCSALTKISSALFSGYVALENGWDLSISNTISRSRIHILDTIGRSKTYGIWK